MARHWPRIPIDVVAEVAAAAPQIPVPDNATAATGVSENNHLERGVIACCNGGRVEYYSFRIVAR